MPLDAQGNWTPNTSPKQDEIREVCRRKKFVLVSGPRYSGKCTTPGTLVWTSKGLAPLGSMGSAGEDLFSDIDASVMSLHPMQKIAPAQARQFYNSGTRKALILTTERGYELTCSLNHPIWSECEGDIRFRTADEIRELAAGGQSVWMPLMREHDGGWPTDYPVFPYRCFRGQEAKMYEASERIKRAKKGGSNTAAEIIVAAKTAYYTIKKWMATPKRTRTLRIKIDEEIGYLMGLMVGDGCYSPPVFEQYSMGFTSADSEITERMADIIARRFPDCSIRKEAHYGFGLRGTAIRAFFKATGMAPKYSYEKNVPDIIWKCPKSVLIAFIQGLFDTDGTVCRTSGEVSYCTTSTELSVQLQTVLLALGIRSTRTFKTNDYRGAWILHCQEEDEFHKKVGFRLTRKQNRTGRTGAFRRTRSSYPPNILPVLERLHETRKERGVGELSREMHKHVIGGVLRRNTSLSKMRISRLMDTVNGWGDPHFDMFWVNGQVWWDPIKACVPTECPLVDLSVPETENFIGNGFINHNSVGNYHALVEHAWRTNPCNITIITISQKVGFDSGVWQDITKHTLPEWIGYEYTGFPWKRGEARIPWMGRDMKGNPVEGGNFGMEWVQEPYIQNISKAPTVEVSNMYGGVSTIQLDSLQNEMEAESRFKPRRYSMIYVPELETFKSMDTFVTWTECLRLLGLPESQTLFLADSNPPDDSCWWMHDLWWDLMETAEEDLAGFIEDKGWQMSVEELKSWWTSLARVDINVEQNPFADPDHVSRLRAKYAHNPDLYQRYILGLPTRTTSDSIFADVFRPTFHIMGTPKTSKTQDEDSLELMCPEEDCRELMTTWDPGSSSNWSMHFVEKFYPTVEKYGPRVAHYEGFPCFKVLDEVSVIGEDVDAQAFVDEALKKKARWEDIIGNPIRWRHWSDRSIFDQHDIESGKMYRQIIYELSDGVFELDAANKPKGSVRAGVDLIHRLLWEERLWINATCEKLIIALKSIKKPKSSLAVLPKASPHKHPIDDLRYLLIEECADELMRMTMLNFRKSKFGANGKKGNLVCVRV